MPGSAVDTDQYCLRIRSNCFQKSCFLVADADSDTDAVVVVAGVVVAAGAAAADPTTKRGMTRRIVVGYTRSAGGIGR